MVPGRAVGVLSSLGKEGAQERTCSMWFGQGSLEEQNRWDEWILKQCVRLVSTVVWGVSPTGEVVVFTLQSIRTRELLGSQS